MWQEPQASPETALLRQQDGATIRRLVAALPQPFREAIVLREVNDLSYHEIAEVAGVPVGTVMSRLARARAMLRVGVERRGRIDDHELRRMRNPAARADRRRARCRPCARRRGACGGLRRLRREAQGVPRHARSDGRRRPERGRAGAACAAASKRRCRRAVRRASSRRANSFSRRADRSSAALRPARRCPRRLPRALSSPSSATIRSRPSPTKSCRRISARCRPDI